MEGEATLKGLVHQLKHGFRTISLKRLASTSGFHITVTGLLGITGFALAIIKEGKLRKLTSFQWFPNSKTHDPDNSPSVPGLQNLENNCFLNVILQALASCSYFLPFVQKAIEECERSAAEDLVDSLPLTFALAALLEELDVVGGRRVMLSPRSVMLAMEHYIPEFNLTSQQDAAEAFLHLLTSLREEFSGCYQPNCGSLVELCASDCRIITPERREDQSQQERWQQSFVGPFDGILGSILTCQSCSSQISLNFESFHSLPISPVLDARGTIMVGCSLDDCLKQFTVSEQVENYHCTHCWHIAGIKYLSSFGMDEKEIEKLRTCPKQDSCDCHKVLHLDALPWSNKFSFTVKQISIARSPQILCIHLKRVSINVLGEPVKLEGHISFPLVLDLFKFMMHGVAIETWEENFQTRKVQLQYQKPSFHPNNFNIQFDTRNLNYMNNITRGSIFSEELASNESGIAHAQNLPGESSFVQSRGCLKSTHTDVQIQSDDQVPLSFKLASSRSCLYRLVSVVEHFGRAGSGHYTVYRCVKADSFKEDGDNLFEPASMCWFCISDSVVYHVSVEDVLSAEASMLFYEKIL
ncbi:ubiquitin carboxyl-terminal hydrolase 27 isoform X2 [Ziziphus jujuba]|uniref:ubiquitinyl hydrolase 1 n=1 Tax=Ziziphus jujuba TaxID=326968 RepID=A0A6P4AY89_ZIZJJ|nr:ubiquitin carboxyl-terminal hydrolase 27 isoform X2 [Ziziphus jujuba]